MFFFSLNHLIRTCERVCVYKCDCIIYMFMCEWQLVTSWRIQTLLYIDFNYQWSFYVYIFSGIFFFIHSHIFHTLIDVVTKPTSRWQWWNFAYVYVYIWNKWHSKNDSHFFCIPLSNSQIRKMHYLVSVVVNLVFSRHLQLILKCNRMQEKHQ